MAFASKAGAWLCLIRLTILGSLAVGLCLFGEGAFGLREALGQDACQGPPEFIRGGGGILGCARGPDSCPTEPGGSESKVAIYRLKGTGQAFGDSVIDQLKFDAITGTVGGAGTNPPGNEAAEASCFFSTDDATEIAANRIEVISAVYPELPRDCADPEKCLQCLTTVVGTTCHFDCAGKVPRNEMADGDSFDIKITFVHSFRTDHPGPPSMIRFDGFADQWTEFLPEGALPDFVTTEGCNGGAPDEMVLNNNDFLGINDLIPESFWVQAFGVDDTSLGGHCKISTVLSARMPLAGVLENDVVDVTRGPITLYGAICDQSATEADCPPPVR